MQYTHQNGITLSDDQACGTSFCINTSPYIMVVEDDLAILSSILCLLQMEGYTAVGISESVDVQPFLQCAEADLMPQGILLDLMMPGVSGYEIAKWLSQHELYAGISLIVMTADHRISDISNIPGAKDWIRKPFEIDNLLEKVAQLFRIVK